MVRAQVPGGNQAYIVAGYFRSGLQPFQHVIRDGVGDSVGLAARRLGAECGCGDAFVKLVMVK